MTVKECYDKAGADYADAINRLGTDALIKRFSIKFLDDKSFQSLKESIEAKDAEGAFSAAHTLKGVAVNLSFTSLYEVSSELTEKLRGGKLEDYEELYAAVAQQYERVVNAIKELNAE